MRTNMVIKVTFGDLRAQQIGAISIYHTSEERFSRALIG